MLKGSIFSKHLLPSLMQWEQFRSSSSSSSNSGSSSSDRSLWTCVKGKDEHKCDQTHSLVDCEWNCAYPASAPKDCLPPRRRFVLAQLPGPPRPFGVPYLCEPSPGCLSLALSLSLLRTTTLSFGSKWGSRCEDLCKHTMHKVILFAGVVDACSLLSTCKRLASRTDQNGSLILVELLRSRQRLADFATNIELLCEWDYIRWQSPLPLHSDFKLQVADLVGRFLSLDPYFDPEQVLNSVFLPLMQISLCDFVNWARYHLWLPMLQWLRQYVVEEVIVVVAADSVLHKHVVFTGGLFPRVDKWSSPRRRRRQPRRTIMGIELPDDDRGDHRGPLTTLPTNHLQVSMWIHLVNSGLLFPRKNGSVIQGLEYFLGMIELLVRSVEWYSHLARFLDRTMDQLCCFKVPLWESVKLALLRGLERDGTFGRDGVVLIEPDKVVELVRRFHPHLLFNKGDLMMFSIQPTTTLSRDHPRIQALLMLSAAGERCTVPDGDDKAAAVVKSFRELRVDINDLLKQLELAHS